MGRKTKTSKTETIEVPALYAVDNEVNSMSDHELLIEIYSFMKSFRIGFDRAVANARLDRKTLEDLLCVSTSTIQRWRNDGILRYHIMEDGSTYYIFEDVYLALKQGRLFVKGLERVAALERMRTYSLGLLKGFFAEDLEPEDLLKEQLNTKKPCTRKNLLKG